jgi:hypothetical protein
MKYLVSIFLLIAVLSPCVMAQDRPKVEVFGGFAYERWGEVPLRGWNAAVAFNLNKWLSIAGDFSGVYGSTSEYGTVYNPYKAIMWLNVDKKVASFTGGPQFSIRHDKTMIFFHLLLGGTRVDERWARDVYFSVNETMYAAIGGGGLDYSINKRFSVRLFQVDYHRWLRHPHEPHKLGHHVRASAGLVVKF